MHALAALCANRRVATGSRSPSAEEGASARGRARIYGCTLGREGGGREVLPVQHPILALQAILLCVCLDLAEPVCNGS